MKRNVPSTIGKLLFVSGLAAGFGQATLFAGTMNLSTGLDSGGNLITTGGGCDANWVQTAGPAPACAGGNGQVVTPANADWFGGWLADGPNSDWITSDVNSTANGSPLPTYQIQFFLGDLVGASITFSWAIDDQGTISLNGNNIGTLGSGAWGGLTPIAANASSFLVAGLNTLTISMTDSDNFLEGVRFEGSVSGSVGIPEPATVTTLLVGIGTLMLRFRRRRA